MRQALHDTFTILTHEFRLLIHDEGVLMFCLIVPLLYPLLYSWIYNNEVVRDVPVVIVDQSRTHTTRDFIRRLDATPDVSTALHAPTLAQAEQLVAKQKARGIVLFPSDFDTRIQRGETAHVSLYCDMSLMLTYRAIYMATQAVASQMGAEIQAPKAGGTTQRDDQVNTLPLAFDEVQIFNTQGAYGNALLPPVLILILQQTLILGIGLAAGTARERNAYGHLVTITKGHHTGIFRIVIGKTLCYLTLYILLAAYVLLAVPHFFHLTQLPRPEALVALTLPFLLAAIFFAMIISCAVRYRENIMLLAVFTSVPFLFLSGATWPQSNIPAAWQGIATLLPSTFAIQAFVRLNTMGATIEDIYPQIRALTLQAAIYLIITCLMYRWQIIRAVKTYKETRKGKEEERSM